MVTKALVASIKAYQRFVSPWLGNRCRFHPSCSCYAEQALVRHGVARGGWLALARISRCHPFCEGGLDPVPETFTWTPWAKHGRS
jgi:putative membrane protein insertion efficiency factor